MRSLLALGLVAILSTLASAQEAGGRSSLAVIYFSQMSSEIKPEDRPGIIGAVDLALSRSIDPKRIEFLSGMWECVNEVLAQRADNTDADVLAAARKCSDSTDSSGKRLAKIDFVAILDVKADAHEENGVRRPLFVFRSNLYFVETGAVVAKSTQATIAGSMFPDKCAGACFVDIVARDIVPFAEAHGRRMAEDVVAWVSPSTTRR